MSINGIDLQKLSASHVILIPIRSFSDAKSRLSAILDASNRTNLMLDCAQKVIAASKDLPKLVLTSDPLVQTFAQNHGCHLIEDKGGGLNPAIQYAYNLLGEHGIEHVTIAHADLPLAQNLTNLMVKGQSTIVPDRKHDGTNVISLPAAYDFHFSYGPNSFERHLHEARRLGLEINVDEDPALTIDIDTPDDLVELLNNHKFIFRHLEI
jgi:2-phospho-L-lactate guanylyltransferase